MDFDSRLDSHNQAFVPQRGGAYEEAPPIKVKNFEMDTSQRSATSYQKGRTQIPSPSTRVQ